MKKGRSMKRNVFLALMMAAPLAFAQAPMKDAAKPEPMKEAAKPMADKAAAKKGANPKRLEDARHCLEKQTSTEIIKCSEEYL